MRPYIECVLHTAPQGGTEVTVAVQGPAVMGGKLEDPNRMTVEVVFRPQAGLPGPRERGFEATLRGLVEGACVRSAHPRCCVSLVVQVGADAGSLLACAMNAACLALLDAGVPLRSTFGAACVALSADGSRVLADPDAGEEEASPGVVVSVGPPAPGGGGDGGWGARAPARGPRRGAALRTLPRAPCPQTAAFLVGAVGEAGAPLPRGGAGAEGARGPGLLALDARGHVAGEELMRCADLAARACDQAGGLIRRTVEAGVRT